MSQIAALIGLVALVACEFVVPMAVNGATTELATPLATPSHAPFEVPSAVPLSLLIRNDGIEDDRLLGGSTPVCARVAVHHTRLDDGRWVMERAIDGIVIPAGATVILEPGGSHLMLQGLRVDLVQGETFPLTLHFARSGEVTVTTRVRRRVDAAGVTPIPPVVKGDLSISFASAPPAPAPTTAA